MKTLRPFLFGAARLRFFNECPFSFSYLALCRDCASLALLSRLGRFLFFLVAAGFLLIAFTACAGGGGGSGGSSGGSMNNGSIGNGSMGDGPGNGDPPIVDDDNDRIANADDNCPDDPNNDQLDTDGDKVGDACDDDDDNDGLGDNDPIEQLMNSNNVRCSLLVDCDRDSVRDIDEVAAACVIKADCDDDNVRDGNEAAAECVQDTDCDNDNSPDGTDIDDDGDGLIEIANATELDAVRHQLDGTGRKLSASGMLDQTGCGSNAGDSCSGYELVANISLAAYANADSGKGWRPLGNDTTTEAGCDGAVFNGTFEGNGFMISNLSINRPEEDCVGLFGYTANSEIRNLRLSAETVIGSINVGGLVGLGDSSTRIHSCSVVANEVRGLSDHVGGLVGFGDSSTRIYSSSVVVGVVRGVNGIGGLVGWGVNQIHSSSVVAGKVIGNRNLGGLIGNGLSAMIYSSSVVVGEVNVTSENIVGNGRTAGGLAGNGALAQIYSSSVVAGMVRGDNHDIGGLIGSGLSGRIHSSLVVVNEMSGSSSVGGLVGDFGSGKVAYSYVVSGSDTDMLAGTGSGTGVASYWDSETSGRGNGNHGEAKTSNELRGPDDYEGIYENWDEDMNIFGDEDEPLAVWCDRDHSGSIEESEKIDANLIWDFGDSDEYPAIRCTSLEPDEWRVWWSLEGTPAKPTLNRDRLDQLLP